MKFLTAVVTVFALVGFGGAALADCAQHAKMNETTAQQDKAPAWPRAS
jgi:hypothetical protein